MNDIAAVRMAKSGGDLHSIAQYGLDGQAFAGDQSIERLALDQLHDDIQLGIEFANFMYGANVWMAKSGRGAGFVQQILSRGVRGDGAFAQNLEGYIAMEKFIASAVDDTHAAFAELRINTVVAEDLADHGYTPVP